MRSESRYFTLIGFNYILLEAYFVANAVHFETLNGRLPLKHGSDRRETSGKRVSDDPRHFIFRRRTKIFRPKFWIPKSVFHYFGQVFEELRPNGPQNQILHQILL